MDQERHIGRADQQAVAQFSGAEITAVRSADDQFIYASLSQLCQAIGLDTESQRERIAEHAVLAEGLCQFDLASSGRVLTTWCLKVNLIPLWLALVPVKRLKLEKRERVLLYQRQVADVLTRLFGPTQLVTEASEALSVQGAPPYAEGLAIARLAAETAELTGKFEGFVTSVEAPLTGLEARLSAKEGITEEQAQHISDLIKQAGIALSQKLGGGNYIGTLYGRFYKTFGVTSYKAITQAQYPKAVAWLEKEIRQNQAR